MPYTPPSVRSPTASRPSTPRAETFLVSPPQLQSPTHPLSPTSHSFRVHLPRSLSSQTQPSKHQRIPSVSHPAGEALTHSERAIVPPTSEQMGSQTSTTTVVEPTVGSTRPFNRSPTSSDEDVSDQRGRGRAVANLAELQAAIQIIEQHRSGSPDTHAHPETANARTTLGLPEAQIHAQASDRTSRTTTPDRRSALSEGARKITHSRSNTEDSAFLDFPRNKFEPPSTPAHSPSASDTEDDDDKVDLPNKPTLLRKKSGELVRPALRASSKTRRRPSSMPGTPTYSKAVHFQEGSLEHVRHFLQVDRPIAVSAGSSPVESLDDETEFPFTHPFEWDIELTNFPRDPLFQLTHPVKMEKVYLSADTRDLIGAVVVKNIAFHKLVVARFTLDNWKTTSEVVAEYNADVRKKLATDGYDRFTFNIKLDDQANLECKTMFICIRYHVNGTDYWDNNSNFNYQVDFSKTYKPQNGKSGVMARGGRPLPRSKPSIEFSSPRMRPRSVPSFDDFAITPNEFNSALNPASMMGESPIRFRNRPATQEIMPDSPGKPKGSSSQQAFGNRYDFGASLSAAMQLPPAAPFTKREAKSSSTAPPASALKVRTSPSAGKSASSTEAAKARSGESGKPTALTSEKPSLQSPSYHELLDRYCFFGSAGKPAPSPSHDQKSRPAQIDGASDDVSKSTPARMSSSPPHATVSSPQRTASPAEERKSASKVTSPGLSRSTSPMSGSTMGSRSASPGYGYPYHQSMQKGFFDNHGPTAILG